MELLQGVRSHERRTAEQLMQDLTWVLVNETIARRVGELGRRWRRSHSGIDVTDLVVAATAETLKLPLATANVRHFPMFEGLAPPY